MSTVYYDGRYISCEDIYISQEKIDMLSPGMTLEIRDSLYAVLEKKGSWYLVRRARDGRFFMFGAFWKFIPLPKKQYHSVEEFFGLSKLALLNLSFDWDI